MTTSEPTPAPDATPRPARIAPPRTVDGRASGDDELNGWWKAWLGDRHPKARERLIVHYSPLVKFVAGRVGAGLPSSVDPGDLVSAGVFGLIDAVERFEAERGVKFETFAVPRIRGAIFDGLRALDWVPRSVRSRAREVETAIHDLEAAHGRSPSEDEIAAHLGITLHEFQRWLTSVASTTVGPLDRALVAGAEPRSLRGETPDSPAGAFEEDEVRRSVRAEVRKLPDRDKLVLSLYYDEGLTLAEIGGVLGVTESRVSQIHTKAVLQLRSRMSASGML
jgi:RNA polymerase sigma factor for flagellar operon FliA